MSKNTANPGLTPDRRARRRLVVENDEFAAFTRRILRAFARRIASGDVEALSDLVALAEDLGQLTAQAVAGLRTFGYTYADIAARLGVTRQATYKRWPSDPQ